MAEHTCVSSRGARVPFAVQEMAIAGNHREWAFDGGIDVLQGVRGKNNHPTLFAVPQEQIACQIDRKSTRLNSGHGYISYAVFCLKKKSNHTAIYSHVQRISHRLHITYRAVCAS